MNAADIARIHPALRTEPQKAFMTGYLRGLTGSARKTKMPLHLLEFFNQGLEAGTQARKQKEDA